MCVCVRASFTPLGIISGHLWTDSKDSLEQISWDTCDPGLKTSHKKHWYICSNSQQYIVWVKMIDFSNIKYH